MGKKLRNNAQTDFCPDEAKKMYQIITSGAVSAYPRGDKRDLYKYYVGM